MSNEPRSWSSARTMGVVCLALLLIGAAQVPRSKPDERHEVTVRLVLVDVIAVDRDGRFVADLTKADFEVAEDGKKMDLASAELVELKRAGEEAGAGPDAAAPPAAVLVRPPRDSRFIVVFDSINTIRRMLNRSKPEILAKLLSLLEVGQEIVVFELAENGRMLVLQPLTSDRRLIAQAVDKATGSIWVERAADALVVPSIIDGAEPMRVGDMGVVGGFQQSSQAAYEAETRRRFEKTINGLLGVMNAVKDLEGRKSLLFVSGGIPTLSFIRFFEGGGVGDTTAVQSQIAAAKVQDPFKILGQKGFRTGSEIFDDLVRFANSHNISFYTLDPDNYLRYMLGDIAYDNFPRAVGRSFAGTAGLKRPDEIAEIKKGELASLRALAGDTGGAAFLGGDKFEDFAGAIERDFARYYELSFEPKRKKADGKYHKIQVKVLRPGLNVRARPGFLDYTEEQRESLAFASAAYNPSLFKDIPFEARIVPFALGRDKFIFWIHTALSARKILGQGAAADETVLLKFKRTLDDPSGTSGFLSETAVPIVLIPSFLERVRQAEYFGWNCASRETELKPRTYRATFAIYDRALDRMGAVESPLEIPAIEEGGAAKLLTTTVGMLVETGKAMVVPFTIAQDDGTLDVPNRKFFPMAIAHVRRGQRAALLAQIHSSEDPRKMALTVSASRSGSGAAAVQVPAGPVHDGWSRKTGIWNALYELELENLAPGDYGLVLRWTDASGAATVEST
ncbi:MAG: VWA domain-containing protein, partial [Candidatus Aminicenantes bacterium]|nr:VWA domain-containing protein [Candidatus Aminicenantes bacterium]